jgi:hypothetical protein
MRTTTVNREREMARLTLDADHRDQELLCVRVPVFNKMEHGVISGSNDDESDDRREKDHVNNDLGNSQISRGKCDASRKVFQSRVLPYSDYGFFACESLSEGKKKPSISTECLLEQLSGAFFECVKTVC